MIETLPSGIKFESFASEEITGTPDDQECRQALANKLGMKGQAATTAPANPRLFRAITSEELVVYSALLPRLVKMEDYSDEPIPLRVMELIDRAKDSGLMNFRVLCPEPGKIDPVVIANDVPGVYSGTTYIIARWGRELEEWPALMRRYREVMTAKIKSVIWQAQRDLDLIDTPERFKTKVTGYAGLSVSYTADC